MIIYTDSLDHITPAQLVGFFVGWGKPPSPERHLKLLQGSAATLLAIDDATGQVIDFVNAISDGVLMAYIPLLEVLPAYQRQGIGSELMRRMLARLNTLYAIDLLCDPPLQSYYEQLGMRGGAMGMMVRNYERQSGASSLQATG